MSDSGSKCAVTLVSKKTKPTPQLLLLAVVKWAQSLCIKGFVLILILSSSAVARYCCLRVQPEPKKRLVIWKTFSGWLVFTQTFSRKTWLKMVTQISRMLSAEANTEFSGWTVAAWEVMWWYPPGPWADARVGEERAKPAWPSPCSLAGGLAERYHCLAACAWAAVGPSASEGRSGTRTFWCQDLLCLWAPARALEVCGCSSLLQLLVFLLLLCSQVEAFLAFLPVCNVATQHLITLLHNN